jgi:hypothetical protein
MELGVSFVGWLIGGSAGALVGAVIAGIIGLLAIRKGS